MSLQLTSSTNSADARQLGLPNIAFAGRAGSGKTAAADLLVELGYKKFSFAAKIRAIVAELWGVEASNDRAKVLEFGRVARQIDRGVWVRALQRSMNIKPEHAPIVVDDLRMPLEWQMLQAEGFVIVRVMAPRALRIDRLKANGKFQNEEQLDDPTESGLEHLVSPHLIENDGTLDDLYDEVTNIVLKERRRR